MYRPCQQVVELMGTAVTQVVCGNRHTLTFVPSRGRVYGFGLNSCGQLGLRSTTNSVAIPNLVFGPWDNIDKSDKTEEKNIFVKQIFSGGDRSFAYTTTDNNQSSYDARNFEYVRVN